MSNEPSPTHIRESDVEILIQREFDAPRELVWSAWTSQEQLASWWGPTGFGTETEQFDLRPNGQWRFVMRGPDGQEYPNLIIYLEVDAPARLVYKHGNEKDVEPINFTVSMDLEERGDNRTLLTMRMVFPSKDAKDLVVRTYGALDGARQHLDNLASHLQSQAAASSDDGALVIQRVFDAEVATVWQAWTNPEDLIAWFHPEAWTLSTCEMDLRAGGSFFYCMTDGAGGESYGIWHIEKVAAPHRLEFVISFSDAERNIVRAPFDAEWPLRMRTSIHLQPHAGRGRGTVLTMRSEAIEATEAERKTFKNGFGSMQQGWGQTLDNLVKHLA